MRTRQASMGLVSAGRVQAPRRTWVHLEAEKLDDRGLGAILKMTERGEGAACAILASQKRWQRS